MEVIVVFNFLYLIRVARNNHKEHKILFLDKINMFQSKIHDHGLSPLMMQNNLTILSQLLTVHVSSLDRISESDRLLPFVLKPGSE